jgi:hypothetical protein
VDIIQPVPWIPLGGADLRFRSQGYQLNLWTPLVDNPTYSIPENAVVRLTIINQLGQNIATLVNEIQQQGEHSVIFERNGYPSEVYFYRLNIENQFITKKMMIVQ